MSLTIELKFLAGRFHATPWGRHVNEGVAEWPPSPWRALRALVAVWRRTRRDISDDSMGRILEAMLLPPWFHLPPHRVAHTRHYMPWEKKGPLDRTLVFDTFVSLHREEPVFLHWSEADLSANDRGLLASLLDNLPSLGRAESWVEAKLSSEAREWNCRPSPNELNPVPVLCPDLSTALSDEHFPVHDAKALKRGLKPEAYLFDCPRWHLCIDTQIIHAQRWPSVPGARWVNYERPEEFISRRAHRASRQLEPTVVRFVIDGPVLPLVTDTLPVGEQLRRVAMGKFQEWCGKHEREASDFRRLNVHESDGPRYSSQNFSGKSPNGEILSPREHAYFLPTAEGNSRRITYITVFAPKGLSQPEVSALSSIRWLGGKYTDVRCVMTGVANAESYTHPLFGSSSQWVSQTPYLGPDHIGLRGQSRYMRKALRREWNRLSQQVSEWNGVRLVEIDELDHDEIAVLGRPVPFEYRRVRQKHARAYRPSRAYRLHFSQAIRGPLCLGYANHFGMGCFAPE